MKHSLLTSRRALAKTLKWRYKAKAARQEMLFAKYGLERLLVERAPRAVLVAARRQLVLLTRNAAQLAVRAKEVRARNQQFILKD